MASNEVNRILEASGFSLKEMHFHYLGVPICAKKNECFALAEKMTARIQTWSSKNLSFAARTVLINSVLLAIHAYWSQAMAAGPGLIAWDNLCQPKATGGLRFRKVDEWNKAAMGKYIWAISNKEDSLWMKWIHFVYIKNAVWWSYKSPDQGSWYWRRLVTLKDQYRDLTAEYLNALKAWLQWHAATVSLPRLIRWIGRTKVSKFKKQALAASIDCLLYVIWRAQNTRIWEESHEGTECLIKKIKHTAKQRITLCWPRKVKERDKEWFQNL
uniref:Reverse transcriptase n=1 Tax=Cannabis sativa TaxID=3483 RepID=A0A803QQR1_CANSA